MPIWWYSATARSSPSHVRSRRGSLPVEQTAGAVDVSALSIQQTFSSSAMRSIDPFTSHQVKGSLWARAGFANDLYSS